MQSFRLQIFTCSYIFLAFIVLVHLVHVVCWKLTLLYAKLHRAVASIGAREAVASPNKNRFFVFFCFVNLFIWNQNFRLLTFKTFDRLSLFVTKERLSDIRLFTVPYSRVQEVKLPMIPMIKTWYSPQISLIEPYAYSALSQLVRKFMFGSVPQKLDKWNLRNIYIFRS